MKPRAKFLKDAQHAYERLARSREQNRVLRDAIREHRDVILASGRAGGADRALWKAAGLRRVD